MVLKYLQQTTGFEGSLGENDCICYACYKSHLFILKGKRYDSTDSELSKVIESIKEISNGEVKSIEDAKREAMNKITIEVAEMLLNRKVALLCSIHDSICSYASVLIEKVDISTTDTLKTVTARNILSHLTSHLQHHLKYSCGTRKHGTILFRFNEDLIPCLTQALWKARQEQRRNQPPLSNIVSTLDYTESHKVVLERLNSKVLAQVKIFLEKYGTESFEHTKLDFNKIISEIDPELWEAIVLLTRSISERRGTSKASDPQSSVPHIKKLRLFLLCSILFIADNRCCFPLHTLMADIIDSQGGSALLIKILNRFGVCSSAETLLRFIQSKVDEQSELEYFSPEAFMVVSADNIDFLHSYSRVFRGIKSAAGTEHQYKLYNHYPHYHMLDRHHQYSRLLKVSHSLTNQYSRLLKVSHSPTHQHSRLLKVSHSLTNQYSRLLKVSHSHIHQYSRLLKVSHSLANQYSRPLQLSHSPTHQHSRLLKVSHSHTHQYSRLLKVSHSHTHQYSRLLKVSHSHTYQYSRLLKVSHSLANQYSRPLQLSHSSTHQHSRLLKVSHSHTHQYSRLLKVSHSHTHQYSRLLKVSHSLTNQYSRLLKVSHSLTNQYSRLLNVSLAHQSVLSTTPVVSLTHPSALSLTHPSVLSTAQGVSLTRQSVLSTTPVVSLTHPSVLSTAQGVSLTRQSVLSTTPVFYPSALSTAQGVSLTHQSVLSTTPVFYPSALSTAQGVSLTKRKRSFPSPERATRHFKIQHRLRTGRESKNSISECSISECSLMIPIRNVLFKIRNWKISE